MIASVCHWPKETGRKAQGSRVAQLPDPMTALARASRPLQCLNHPTGAPCRSSFAPTDDSLCVHRHPRRTIPRPRHRVESLV
jgi:hypothetical protein